MFHSICIDNKYTGKKENEKNCAPAVVQSKLLCLPCDWLAVEISRGFRLYLHTPEPIKL